MSTVPHLAFNDSRQIPQFGLGVWQTPAAETARVVQAAFDAGYRHIDTAMIYRNEEGVGAAVNAAGIPREDVFVTTKLWNADQGYDKALRALDASLAKMKLDYIDLYLIHWPTPTNNRQVETWKALIEARDSGKAKSIGVSNYRIEDLERIIDATGVVPAANQIELHPWFPQAELREFHAKNRILTEAWSPLARGGELLGDASLQALAKKHGKSVAQIVLRWHVQLGNVVFPKSAHKERIAENIAIFDFALDAGDMALIAKLDRGQRIGPDPATSNM